MLCCVHGALQLPGKAEEQLVSFLTGVDVADVWTRAVDFLVPGPVTVHQRGVRQEVCTPQGRFTWRIHKDQDRLTHTHTHLRGGCCRTSAAC